jgi:excisionase family DNA binding protein
MSESPMLTPEDVAARLKVNPRTVQAWLRSGRLAGLKQGKLWRIRESDLETFLTALGVPSREEGCPPGAPPVSLEERAKRIRAARGSLAHVLGSVDDFLRRKQEDIQWENRRWADREPPEPRAAAPLPSHT